MIERADQGLTTVVFVDIEGSTALLGRVGDEVGTASVRRQLDLVRERIGPYGGREVKSLGDGLLLTFSSPRQAVAFALASQRALKGSAPPVRFGINTGEVIAAHADPLGNAVNAAARIAGRAAGGEVVVSDVVRQLVGTEPAIRFADRGRTRLRGFSERWHLWTAEDSTAEARPTATMGRVEELAAVMELVASTAAASGRVLFFEGEAGIGKTHILREAVAHARRASVTVVEVSADEVVRRAGAIPHGLADALRSGHPVRARLDELLNGAGADDLSYAVIEASVDLVEATARTQPVLIVAEDLHWADDLSLGVLTAIARRVPVSRFSVIGSLRPSPRPVPLDRLLEVVRDGPGRHVRLGALDDVDVYALASSLTGAAPSHALRERLQATAGNPLFVTELLRFLDDDGLLRVESGVAEVAPGATPSNLNETLVRRLSWLPRETNELLRLASLLGSAFTLGDLAVITGRSVIDVAAWLREASLAGLIIGDGDRLAFRHDLIREAVYGHMLGAERRDLHRAAGKALANSGAPTQQVAQQFARGARPGDLEAVTWLERAGVETMSVSPSSAIALFKDALAFAPVPWAGRAVLQARMIELLAWCGRFDEAQTIANAILCASPDADLEFAALRGLSAVHGNRGDALTAVTVLHRAADAPGAPTDEAVRLRCVAAQLSMLSGAMSAEAARTIATETMAHGASAGDATTQCLAHQVLGVTDIVNGYATSALEHLGAARALVGSGRVNEASYLIPDAFYAVGLLDLDDVDGAIAAAHEARRRAEGRGALAWVPMTYMIAGGSHFYAGLWDDAVAEVEAGLAVIEDTGNLNFVLYHHAVLAKIALHRGDIATAEGHLAAGMQKLSGGLSLFGADWLVHTQAEFLVATGEDGTALSIAEAAWAMTAPIRYFYGHRSRGIFLVRQALAAGRDELARSVTAELEEGARRSPAQSAAAAALLCRGLVDRGADLVLEAVATYRRTPLRPLLAGCCEDAARVLVAVDRREEAIPLLHEAATISIDIAASADLSRLEAALRDLGVRRVRPQLRRPAFGWESLTPMENEVSRLAAEGLTNPEIGARLYISRRTVETHLSHVFTKLGFAGRTQLAAELSRRATGG